MNQSSRETSADTPLLITCEHGGNQVPAPYRHLFHSGSALLESHRGFDPGALIMARTMARYFSAPILVSTVSRLLVDLNRSVGHRNLHMEAIQELPADIRREIVAHHYQPYRTEAERLVTQGITRSGSVIHISCHSFTNNLNGVIRHADVGLLYDPARKRESALCAEWKSILKALAPGLRVRRNYPYEGRDDGLTSSLRKRFPPAAYLGIELELNQKNLLGPATQWTALRKSIITSLETALNDHHP